MDMNNVGFGMLGGVHNNSTSIAAVPRSFCNLTTIKISIARAV